jgi:hypothetical protein
LWQLAQFALKSASPFCANTLFEKENSAVKSKAASAV